MALGTDTDRRVKECIKEQYANGGPLRQAGVAQEQEEALSAQPLPSHIAGAEFCNASQGNRAQIAPTVTFTDAFMLELFSAWCGAASKDPDLAREQLAKTLRDQLSGYWSGHTAYSIATLGGFLVDAKPGEAKRLTALGEAFMAQYGHMVKPIEPPQ